MSSRATLAALPAGARALACALAVVLAMLANACAPKAPPVVPGAPKYPEFVFPDVPADLATSAQVRAHDAAWRQLQAGDLKGAWRAFEQVAKKDSTFYPADAGAGWAALAARDGKQAVAAFDRALQRAPKYVPALVGRGEALLSLKDERAALASFESALAVQPELPDVRRRVEVLRFRGLEDQLNTARAARNAGRLDEARSAYARALELSPDSPLVYRELAEVDRKAGDLAAALEHARAAVRIDPSDGSGLVLVGEILEARGEPPAAIDAYLQAQALDPSPEIAERIERLRRQAALAQLPQQYRDLGSAARVTRGDLAALLGIRLEAAVKSARQRDAVLLTDVRGHWAAIWIDAVARAGIMQPFANHTFQPRNVVRRGDLAVVSSRVLAVIGSRDRKLAEPWSGKRLAFPDLGSGHAMHAAASVAVASGVMTRLANEAFGVSAVVSGTEAIETVDRLDALAARAGLSSSKGGGR
jgi:tetratricopeptide (TPR) repeat protein